MTNEGILLDDRNLMEEERSAVNKQKKAPAAEKILNIVRHVLTILGGAFFVFLILDQYNPASNYLTNDITGKLRWVLCFLALVYPTVSWFWNRRRANVLAEKAYEEGRAAGIEEVRARMRADLRPRASLEEEKESQSFEEDYTE